MCIRDSDNRGRVRNEVIRFMITWEWVILRCYKLHSPFSSSFTISPVSYTHLIELKNWQTAVLEYMFPNPYGIDQAPLWANSLGHVSGIREKIDVYKRQEHFH